MSDDCELTTREAFEQVTTAGLFAAGEVVRQLPTVAANPETLAVVSVALPAFGLAIGRHLHKLYAHRLPAFVRGYASAVGKPEDLRQHADAHKDDDTQHDTMYRAFRAMLDAASPEVVEVLGFLAGTYTYSSQTPDAFFRSLGRLLCDLEDGELDELRRMLAAAHERRADFAEVGSMELRTSHNNHDEATIDAIYGSSQYDELGVFRCGLRFLMLLKREGLGYAVSPHVLQTECITDDQAIDLVLDTIEKILSIIDPK